MNRAVRELIAISCGSAAFVLALIVVGYLGVLVLVFRTGAVYSALVAGIVLPVTFIAWRAARLRLHLPGLSRRVILVLLAAYGVTWALGAPRVHTELAAAEITQYKKLKAEAEYYRVRDGHPHIEFFATVPLAPGILLTYHEYQIASLWGEGEWALHAWYFFGVRRIIGMGTWIS